MASRPAPAPETAPGSADGAGSPLADGGCACGALRYRLLRPPLFVHCCHCTRCQRETGGPYAHHAMLEYSAMELLQGEPEFVGVPTDSGNTHWVVRCPECRCAVWNEHGSRRAVTRYVRVGTLDQPWRFAPQAHIFVRSAQPWVRWRDDAPAFDTWYESAKLWPAESLARWQAAKTELQAQKAAQRAAAAPGRHPGPGRSNRGR